VFLSFVSGMLLLSFLSDGEVSVPLGIDLCMVVFIVSFLLFGAVIALTALTLSRSLPGPTHKRAIYVLGLYPLVIASFLLASATDWFLPSIVFGLPLFLAGAIVLPYSAHVVRSGLFVRRGKDFAMVVCYSCGRPLEFHADDAVVVCRACKTPNQNPVIVAGPPFAPPKEGGPRVGGPQVGGPQVGGPGGQT